MKSRGLIIMTAAIALWLIPILAFGLDADLYGYTKAADISGKLSVSVDGRVLDLSGFSSQFYHPLEVYISRGYTPSEGRIVGVIPAGFRGGMTFSPIPEITGQDMILLKIPGWTVPVGLGLFGD